MRTIRYTKEMSKIITIQMRNIRLGGKCHSILTFQNNFLNKMDLLYSQARIWMWVWDILVLGTLGPWNPWTLEPLVLGTPPNYWKIVRIYCKFGALIIKIKNLLCWKAPPHQRNCLFWCWKDPRMMKSCLSITQSLSTWPRPCSKLTLVEDTERTAR